MGADPLSGGWLISGRLPAWQSRLVRQLQARCPRDRDVIWILSSGTQSINQVKAIGLSVEAIEASARSVNRFLQITSADRWALALPTYHIGGYAILVRAHLSRSRVFRLDKWNPKKFAEFVSKNRITLTSLVPTQVHDLVTSKLYSPESLRAIVVGGGHLAPDLYAGARALGWPVLPSYGLTECGSQVATASLKSLEAPDYPPLEILPHAQIKTVEGRVWIQTESACRYVATLNKSGQFTIEYPFRQGWLPTEDLGEVQQNQFVPRGRRDEVVKVLGVLVSLLQVESELCPFVRHLKGKFVVLDMPSPRAGAELIAVTDSEDSLREWEQALSDYNRKALGPFRIFKLAWLPQIPLTTLGKVRRRELRSALCGRALTESLVTGAQN